MAAPYNPPVKNEEFIFYVALRSRSTGQFQVNPTLASGDVKVKKDSGAPANLGTLPAVDNASEIWVKVTLTSTEMNADNVMIQFIDAAGAEWDDLTISIPTTA
jgi:hypothetical protein